MKDGVRWGMEQRAAVARALLREGHGILREIGAHCKIFRQHSLQPGDLFGIVSKGFPFREGVIGGKGGAHSAAEAIGVVDAPEPVPE